MGKKTGFIEYERNTPAYQAVKKRTKNFKEFIKPLTKQEEQTQGARCMDCGIPFCHTEWGCPLGNIIPDFNDFVYNGDYHNAYLTLKKTNNFPDITGRICPAPCESACVLGIHQDPVAIKTIEYAIGKEASKQGWDRPNPPSLRTGKSVGIIGSGPAGMACADQLNQAGHKVTVYERDDRIGGLMTYGIPNFKLDKDLVFKHVERMKKEGVNFVVNCEIGKDVSLKQLRKENQAVVLATGSTVPRDLVVENREVEQVYFAMDFLKQTTKKVLKVKEDEIKGQPLKKIEVKGKRVLVVGGGDTGSDCIGSSIRQGCKSVTQIEIMPCPPKDRDETMPWPMYRRVFQVSSSQEEGCKRGFSIMVKKLLTDKSGNLRGVEYVELEWTKDRRSFKEVGGSKEIKTDVIFLAMGFVGPEKELASDDGLDFSERGTIKTKDGSYRTNLDGMFTAGDARRGQSLVVWAISEGRECAREVDSFLSKKRSNLPSKDQSFYTPEREMQK